MVSDLLYTNTLEGNMKETLIQRVYLFEIADCFIKYRTLFHLRRTIQIKLCPCTGYAGQRSLAGFNYTLNS